MKASLNLLLGACLVTAVSAQPSGIQEVFGFPCSSSGPGAVCPEGSAPDALIHASDGNIYGVSRGPNVYAGTGGTIFRLTTAGQLTVLYTFPLNTTTRFYDNGRAPVSIAEGSDGMLYGAASVGGTTSASSGTLWRIHKDGTGFQVLIRYSTNSTTGSFPNRIIAASDGNLYGTTGYGGSFSATVCQGLGCGVVFRLTTGGVYTALHAFNGTTDSRYPVGIIQASDGNFYGGAGDIGYGTLFRISPSGVFSTIYSFLSNTYPLAAVMQASNGLLYGFSHVVSAPTVEFFSATLSGSVQNLQWITLPLYKQYGVSQLLQASDGNLWTSTAEGGPSNWGTVFAISPGGTVVHTLGFTGTNGAFATGGLIQTPDGTLWGTATEKGTTSTGATAYGVIYKVTGLPAK